MPGRTLTPSTRIEPNINGSVFGRASKDCYYLASGPELKLKETIRKETVLTTTDVCEPSIEGETVEMSKLLENTQVGCSMTFPIRLIRQTLLLPTTICFDQ